MITHVEDVQAGKIIRENLPRIIKAINEYKTDVAAIGDEIVKIAKEFVITNGTYRTGRLHDSIRWIPKSQGIQLIADAKEGESHYAGHIEYGFVGRDGLPKGSRCDS